MRSRAASAVSATQARSADDPTPVNEAEEPRAEGDKQMEGKEQQHEKDDSGKQTTDMEAEEEQPDVLPENAKQEGSVPMDGGDELQDQPIVKSDLRRRIRRKRPADIYLENIGNPNQKVRVIGAEPVSEDASDQSMSLMLSMIEEDEEMMQWEDLTDELILSEMVEEESGGLLISSLAKDNMKKELTPNEIAEDYAKLPLSLSHFEGIFGAISGLPLPADKVREGRLRELK